MAYGQTYTDAEGNTYTYAPKTAQQNEFITEFGVEDRLRIQDKARADAAGVSGVEYIDYAEALKNYEDRSDTELLVNRRARENATDFAQQNFARRRVQEAGATQPSTVGSTTVVFGDNAGDRFTTDANTGASTSTSDTRKVGTPTNATEDSSN